MRKFLLKSLLLLPIPLIVVFTNYVIDPAHLMGGGSYERGIASIMIAGENVANITNYDERLLQKYYIADLSSKKDTVVLGSSRAMQICSDSFPSGTFFNNSVSSATVEDYVAIYGMYRQRNLIPSTVFLGLDPWLLNKNNGLSGWKSVQADYELTEGLLGSSYSPPNSFMFANLELDKILALASPAYFQQSVSIEMSNLRSGRPVPIDSGTALASGKTPYYPTKNLEEDTAIKHWDGCLSYDRAFRSRSIAEVRAAAIAYASQPQIVAMGSFFELDRNAGRELDDLITLMTKDGVHVVLLMFPYHPITYELLTNSPDYAIIVQVQKYFENLGRAHGLEIIGSYDPSDCALDESDFYDGLHPNILATKKLLESRLRGCARLAGQY